MTRSALVLAALLLLVPSVVHAEAARVVAAMRDGTEDITFRHNSLWLAVPELDFEEVTFALTDDDIVVRYDVVNLSHRTRPDEGFSFFFFARSPGYSRVEVWVTWLPRYYGEAAGPHYNLLLITTDGRCATCGGAVPELEGEWNVTDSSITYRIPRHHFTGPLTDTWLYSMVFLPTTTNSVTGTVMLGDFIPDHGRGPDVPTG
ncbi:MAG TPA: hypothetical protein VNX21_01845 [Candidatus Thermoplasmatota archaeon]|nr:hypothetical protein [Candidatus Thermoplasmatota archaeon]